MRKIKDVLRLHYESGLKRRVIAYSVGTSHTTVGDYLNRAARAGLSWPLPEGLDEAQLEQLLFPPPVTLPSDQRPVPDWAHIHQELKRKSVTLGPLWEEYQHIHPEEYRYSRFCDLYREWSGKLLVLHLQLNLVHAQFVPSSAGFLPGCAWTGVGDAMDRTCALAR